VVTEDEGPFAVTEGTQVLKVSATGDPYPMIENKERVRVEETKITLPQLSDAVLGYVRHRRCETLQPAPT
jgi:hypothetical protein